MKRLGEGKTGKAEQLQHLCQRWFTLLQCGAWKYRRDVCFEEQYSSICLDMFKDSIAQFLISKFFISVFLRLVREDTAFLQNKRVQESYHAALSEAYVAIFITASVFLFSF